MFEIATACVVGIAMASSFSRSGLLLSLYLKFELIYWLPVLDRFRNWLYSGEASIFNEFSDTLELASV